MAPQRQQEKGNSLAGEGEVCYFCRYCGEFLIFKRGHVRRPTAGCTRREGFGKPEEQRGGAREGR